MRPSSRRNNELREIEIIRHFTKHAHGSILISIGDTKVICNATVVEGVPRFLKGKGEGWLTAEYGMLPCSTHDRSDREAARGKQTGRTQEIQRLIGRSLRTMVNLKALGENTIMVDCDVIQADGGTRTASITGGCLAVYDAIHHMKRRKMLRGEAFNGLIAAISAGVYQQEVILDLDYAEDSSAETDMNFVMDSHGRIIELQGTAEKHPFSSEQLNDMLTLASQGISELMEHQRQAIGL